MKSDKAITIPCAFSGLVNDNDAMELRVLKRKWGLICDFKAFS
jgi:hypothetical protein